MIGAAAWKVHLAVGPRATAWMKLHTYVPAAVSLSQSGVWPLSHATDAAWVQRRRWIVPSLSPGGVPSYHLTAPSLRVCRLGRGLAVAVCVPAGSWAWAWL